ncbi:MAG: thioredoxin family protein [Ignavibacteria bacterium]|nr:thioredoxin family protein [Ignavibacteria bacterium]
MAWLIAMFSAISMSAVDLPDGVKVGDPAPDFNIRNIDNKRISLSTFKEAKGIILVFTCNSCPFSKKYEDRIINLHTKYAGKGWPVLAVNSNDSTISEEDSFSAMQMLASEHGYKFPYGLDETQTMAMKYGARRTPHVFLIQINNSKFTVTYIGAIDDNANDPSKVETRFVENAIDNMIKGEPVEPSITKAIGCTIKWRNH